MLHKALGLTLTLNFEKIIEDLDEQNMRKCNYVWFALNFFKLHKSLTDCLIKSKSKSKSTILIFQIFQPNLLLNTKTSVVVFFSALHNNCYGPVTRIAVGLGSC